MHKNGTGTMARVDSKQTVIASSWNKRKSGLGGGGGGAYMKVSSGSGLMLFELDWVKFQDFDLCICLFWYTCLVCQVVKS
jgi:hypothetical protein